MPKFLVTTTDNPYNPFTEFDEWYAFDIGKGYNTCSFLARLAITSNELSDEVNQEAINQAVDQIIRVNHLGIYKKVQLEDAPNAG